MTNKEVVKMNMEQLKDVLNTNYKAAAKADKALGESIAYAAKKSKDDPKSVKKADLVDLVKQVITTLGDKFQTTVAQTTLKPVVAENSLKPVKGGKKAPADEPKEEEAPAEAPAKDEPKKSPAKPEKKSPAKDAKKSTDEPKVLKTQVEIATAEVFPNELKLGDETYELAKDITSMDELYEVMTKDEEILFAYYWSKRLLRQYDYFGRWLGQPSQFDNDLDLASPLHISDEKKVAYQVSVYTEAMYTVLPKDFEEVDGVRVSGGIEFQIYRKK